MSLEQCWSFLVASSRESQNLAYATESTDFHRSEKSSKQQYYQLEEIQPPSSKGCNKTPQTAMNELKYKSHPMGKRETVSISQLGKLRNT